MSGKPSSRQGKAQRWATRNLLRGDLTTLSSIAKSDHEHVSRHQIDRLLARGFVRLRESGRARITMKGRLALLLRPTSHQDQSDQSNASSPPAAA